MKKGVINKSRKESDFTKRIPPKEREEYIKGFIARCEAKLLMPYIRIAKHDKNYREIEYEINVDDLQEARRKIEFEAHRQWARAENLSTQNQRYKQALEEILEDGGNTEHTAQICIKAIKEGEANDHN